MPIYEYRCKSCGHELEKLQRMSDDALTDCPACEKPDLQRLISAAGFRLKGSGWYETDFKTGKKRNVIGADSSDSPKKDDKSTTGDKESKKTGSVSESGKKDKSSANTSSNSGNKSGSKDKSAA